MESAYSAEFLLPGMNFSAISLNNINFSGSWDWMMILIFLAVALVYGLAMGRNRLVVLMLGVYFSFLLTTLLLLLLFALTSIFFIRKGFLTNATIFLYNNLSSTGFAM